jgi:Putative MetA-pathway of phenol degradation
VRVWNGCVLTRPRQLLTIAVASLACVVFFAAPARAQAARDYLNTPVDQLSLTLDLIKTKGESAPASGLALPNNYTVSSLVYPFILWSFSQNGKYGGVSFAPSYTSVGVTGANGTVKASGFTDPGIAIHANIFGLPALRREQMATAMPQTFLSVHLTVTPPLGEYDRDAPVNVGANRWSFTPLVNLNITPDKGVQWIEVYASTRFFTDNNEYQGSQLLSQDPLVMVSAHYSHNIGKRSYAAIGASYDYGGETSVDHVAQANRANGWRPTAAISTVIGPVRVGLRYENTSTKPTDARRNGLFEIEIAMLLF